MSGETVHRIRCDGCGCYLRGGRAAPKHWGPMYADTYPSLLDAYDAAEATGWLVMGNLNTHCPGCRAKEDDDALNDTGLVAVAGAVVVVVAPIGTYLVVDGAVRRVTVNEPAEDCIVCDAQRYGHCHACGGGIYEEFDG